jgi:hypothetical protein
MGGSYRQVKDPDRKSLRENQARRVIASAWGISEESSLMESF